MKSTCRLLVLIPNGFFTTKFPFWLVELSVIRQEPAALPEVGKSEYATFGVTFVINPNAASCPPPKRPPLKSFAYQVVKLFCPEGNTVTVPLLPQLAGVMDFVLVYPAKNAGLVWAKEFGQTVFETMVVYTLFPFVDDVGGV